MTVPSPIIINPYQLPVIVEMLQALQAAGNVIVSVSVSSVVCNVYNFTIHYTQPNGEPGIKQGTLNCTSGYYN